MAGKTVLDSGLPWPYFYRGILLKSGDREPRPAPCFFLSRFGWLWSDLPSEGPRRGKEAFARALCRRGAAKAQLGFLEEALDDLNKAVERDPKDAEALRWRAEARRFLGDYLSWDHRRFESRGWDSISHPSAVDSYSYQSLVYCRSGHYAAAMKSLDQAIRLAPEDPELRAQRSELHVLMNRPEQAIRDARRAGRLRPRSDWPRFLRLRLDLFYDRRAQASRALSRLAQADAKSLSQEAVFYRGCLSLKAGRARRALKDFQGLALSADSQALALKARFYWLAAKSKRFATAGAGSAASKGGGGAKLYLCGLGYFPPYTATLDALGVLGGCDVLVNNVIGGETRELLGMFCKDVRQSAYDLRMRGDEEFWVRRIARLLRRGRTVGFVTRGHPLCFGGLGMNLVKLSKSLNVSCQVLGAVSSSDIISASISQAMGMDLEGVRIYTPRAVIRDAARLDATKPLIIVGDDDVGREELERLGGALDGHYPAEHPCWRFGPVYDMDPTALSLAEVARLPKIGAAETFYLPPLKGSPGH